MTLIGKREHFFPQIPSSLYISLTRGLKQFLIGIFLSLDTLFGLALSVGFYILLCLIPQVIIVLYD